MKYPTLTELNASRQMIDVFSGYNHNLRIPEGEFYEMENLTSADYPVLSPRPKRGVYESPSAPYGLISKDALCYVDGSYFYINKNKVEGLTLTQGTKTLISMGAYVIIRPDNVWVNTVPKKQGEYEWGRIEATLIVNDGEVSYEPCYLDGEVYEIDYTGANPPDNPTDKTLWLDTSSDPQVLKRYSTSQEQWVSIPTTYVKITFSSLSSNLNELFSENDGVHVMGIAVPELSDLVNTPIIVRKVGTNYIIFTGMLSAAVKQQASENNIEIKRKMPEMDFVIESGNRLWGCRYGVDFKGDIVNEIYASKLGDFKNWHCFDGISTDSYVASLGTDGQFTGAVTYLGYPMFFKENCVHKVYGNYPANYQIQTTACRGVQKGCHKSLAIVNEVLYYKSRSAICAYDGSLPVEMSSALGDMTYADATAGVLGNKYYISMRDVNETVPAYKYHLFVYDTLRGMWHREDHTQATEFCNSSGNLYYIDAEDKKIKAIREIDKSLDPELASEDKPIKWMATTGLIGTDSPDKKYISRLVVRLLVPIGTRVYCSIEYDSCGGWEQLFTMSGTSLRTFSIPIRPKRCDHLRLKIEGEGDCKIYSICKTIEQGSDL